MTANKNKHQNNPKGDSNVENKKKRILTLCVSILVFITLLTAVVGIVKIIKDRNASILVELDHPILDDFVASAVYINNSNVGVAVLQDLYAHNKATIEANEGFVDLMTIGGYDLMLVRVKALTLENTSISDDDFALMVSEAHQINVIYSTVAFACNGSPKGGSTSGEWNTFPVVIGWNYLFEDGKISCGMPGEIKLKPLTGKITGLENYLDVWRSDENADTLIAFKPFAKSPSMI